MEDEGDPRKFWNNLKPLFSDTSNSTKHDVIYLDEQETLESVPQIFNEFFTQIGLKLKSKILPLSELGEHKLDDACNQGIPVSYPTPNSQHNP